MTYDDLNNIVHETACSIASQVGRDLSNTEKDALNDKLSEFLQNIDVEVTEDDI